MDINIFSKGVVLIGMRESYVKTLNTFRGNRIYIQWLPPSLYCSMFGLFQIQVKCIPKLEDLTKAEKKLYFPLCGRDNKKENFGWYKGRLVCLDYG